MHWSKCHGIEGCDFDFWPPKSSTMRLADAQISDFNEVRFFKLKYIFIARLEIECRKRRNT